MCPAECFHLVAGKRTLSSTTFPLPSKHMAALSPFSFISVQGVLSKNSDSSPTTQTLSLFLCIASVLILSGTEQCSASVNRSFSD